MNLYKVWQDVNNNWDTYDSAVICAESEEEAKTIADKELSGFCRVDWAEMEDVYCKLIGTALLDTEKGVVVASFNAG